MTNNNAIQCPQILQSHLIEIVGERVEQQETWVKRIAAKEIIELDLLHYPRNRQDLMTAVLEIAGLIYRLADPSTYFFAELDAEPEPYSAKWILFHALVHLVRIEKDLIAYGWRPEQIRALGLAIHPGESVAWPIASEFVTIEDREGNKRRFYRFSA